MRLRPACCFTSATRNAQPNGSSASFSSGKSDRCEMSLGARLPYSDNALRGVIVNKTFPSRQASAGCRYRRKGRPYEVAIDGVLQDRTRVT